MSQRYLSLTFAILFLHLALPLPFTANAQTGADPKAIAKVWEHVAVIPVGTRVSIKLRDGRPLSGSLDSAGAESLVLKEGKQGTLQTIPYAAIQSIEREEKHGLSTKMKIGIGVVGALFVLSLIGNGFGG